MFWSRVPGFETAAARANARAGRRGHRGPFAGALARLGEWALTATLGPVAARRPSASSSTRRRSRSGTVDLDNTYAAAGQAGPEVSVCFWRAFGATGSASPAAAVGGFGRVLKTSLFGRWIASMRSYASSVAVYLSFCILDGCRGGFLNFLAVGPR